MKDNKHSIWLPLIGFDRDKEDLGVSEYIEQLGFMPESLYLMIGHPDIINQHEGMDKEFTFHIDFCSYYGAPHNGFRARQPWTNYETRKLVSLLKERGIDVYVSIFGDFLESSRHREWQEDHRELTSFGVNGRMNLNVLKRFKDGTYYEDFFVKKAVAVMNDYGFAGIQIADFFCPPEHSISNGDFSADMLEQFASYNKDVKYPDDIASRLGFDEQEDIENRQKYIWGELRKEWIDFYSWRWESFWKKVCDAFHEYGKKVLIVNAWTSDPFEAIYRYGIDYKRLYNAGVDRFLAETSTEGIELLDGVGDCFHRLMTSMQMMSVYSPGKSLQNLLGVKDVTEGWDIIHHNPCRAERVIYYSGALFRRQGNNYYNSTNGFMVTLGDGILREEWDWIGEREEVAFSLNPESIDAATVIWSDNELHNAIDEYIRTRRLSTNEITYRLRNFGVSIGAAARIEDIATLDGVLLVPNFDLMSDCEKKAVLAYKKAPVIIITTKEYVDKEETSFDFCVYDKCANYPLCICGLNLKLSSENQKQINALFECCEKVKDNEDLPKDWYDHPFFLTPMPYAGVSDAFMKVCKMVFDLTQMSVFRSDALILPVKTGENLYRIYVFNNKDMYLREKVFSSKEVIEVKNVSKYPVMPSKLIQPPKVKGLGDGAKLDIMEIPDPNAPAEGFLAKVAPKDISIF